MEKLKNIHDHKLTDILKVLIFTLVMLLPGIVFIPSCLYYGFNEHAVNTETTTINYKYESNQVNTLDDLIEGNIYYLDELYINSTGVQSGDDLFYDIIKCESINSVANSAQFDEIFISGYNSKNLNALTISSLDTMALNDPYCYMFCTNENCYISLMIEDDEFYFTNVVFIYHNELYNHLSANHELPQYTEYNEVDEVVINTENTISTQISRNWTQMWQEPMFNWTNNTPLNTGLNGFISIFGINQQSCISNLLIWLLTITAIYVVIDIVLGVFKWLTHMIGNK